MSNRNKPAMAKITRESVKELQGKTSKRICFARYPDQCPKQSDKPKYIGTINLPFLQGIQCVFPDYKLWRNKNKPEPAVWRSIGTKLEFDELEAWTQKQGERVFLRDGLSISIALAHNLQEPGLYTTIGQLEADAKNKKDCSAIKELAKHCCDTIHELPCYEQATMIAAVPTMSTKSFHLPSNIVRTVAKTRSILDGTDKFTWQSEKEKLRNLSFDEKWVELEKTGLRFVDDLKDHDIILIDDLYQSGTTLQFVAMKLQDAGARNVFGLCLVKSLGDTDNQ